MRMIISTIVVVFTLLVGIVILMPVLKSVTEQASASGIPSSVNLIMNLVPGIIAVGLIMVVAGMFTSGGDSYDEEEVEEEPEPEPIKVKRKDAVRILMERYANGEISSEDYSDRMSRL
jgi:uncharacterized membrane protein